LKRILPIAAIVILLAVAVMSGFWQQYQRFLHAPLNIEHGGLLLTVKPGASVSSVVADLQSLGVTRLNWHWKLLNRMQPVMIQAGEYELEAGLAPPDLLALLVSGRVTSYRFTIVEGWSLRQLLENMEKDPVLRHSLDDINEIDGLAGLPSGHAEGWFLPETYAFVRNDSDLQILQRAYQDMQQALSEIWAGRDVGLPYETEYELLIMASIIEKETSLESERATIAGVFVRRLRERWRLETDPTVIYGMGDAYQGNIRRRDLKTDTPYNTYMRHGLPPTPIALPGRASLEAAAHPEPGEVMFFVADGQGGHTFSATLDAHNRAVRQMLNRASRSKSSEKAKRE
jgi:UPF0755 protein